MYLKRMRRLIVALGSDRCGTVSMAALLRLQERTFVSHENCPVPWEFDKEAFEWMMTNKLLSNNRPYGTEVIGDVGYYWINYIGHLLELKPDAKFICLKRDRQETMDSYMIKSSGLNVHPTDDWYRMFPRYDLPKKEAVGAMWDDYYKIAESWQDKYPDKFIIMGMDEALNDEREQKKLLQFARFNQPRVQLHIRLNSNDSDSADAG